MITVVNWEYYNSLYNAVDKTAFDRLAPLAEKRVKSVIGTPRWNSVDPDAFYYDQLRDCICMLIDKLASYGESGAGTGLASVSNDGYTESYVIQTQPQMESELHSCIVQWLSGTGLAGAYKC
jgi:hypothetical protein